MQRQLPLIQVERSFLLVSVLFVIASLFFPVTAQIAAKPVSIIGAGFKPDATYPTTTRANLPRDVAVVGSWLGSDSSIGDIRTLWHSVKGSAVVYVSGYPTARGNELTIETMCRGVVSERPITMQNPGERWDAVFINIERCVSEVPVVRIHARDGSKALGGWLGSSDILAVSRGDRMLVDVLDIVRVLGCTALALTLVYGPGLALSKHYPAFVSPAVIWMPGLLLLLSAGSLEWAVHGGSAGHRCVVVILIAALAALIWNSFASTKAMMDASLARALVNAALIVAVATGRALYSLGPADELYGGTISRTFEPSDRSDSRISYHVAQLVANGQNAYGTLATTLFSPYNFSDRGPIAGIAAAAIISVAGARPPASVPDQPWRPFDPEGFSAYRAAFFVFASVVVLSLYGFVLKAAGVRAALFAVALLSLSPFILHETWFTWPKLLAAAFVISAAYGISCRRFLLAGVSVGVGYLVHPSVLLALPALLAYMCFSRRDIWQRCVSATLLMSGPLLALAVWRLINGVHYSQSGFITYILEDAGGEPGFKGWITMRGLSLANTVIPFWLPFVNSNNHSINGWDGQHLNALAHLDYAYWTTIPFGIGLVYAIVFYQMAVRAARKESVPFLLIILAPFCIFWIYWGASSSGLLREGLQWWFVAVIAFIAVVLADDGPFENTMASRRRRLRACEVVALTLLPTIWADRHILSLSWPVSDIVGIFFVVVASASLAWVTAPTRLR